MTALESLMSATHFERVSDLMQLKDPYKRGALRGESSRQLDDCADFPVAKYTPGSPLGEAALTNANIAQSIRNAYAAAKASAFGGNVLIPAGVWEMGVGGELVFDGSGFAPAKPVRIKGVGSGATSLVWPTPFTGVAIHMRGSGTDPGQGPYTYGGLEGLSLFCDAADVSNTGIGVRIDACIYTEFINVDVHNFMGGKGFECRDYSLGGGYNSQYVQFYNVVAAICGINFDFGDLTNSQAMGLYAGFGQTNDFVFTQNCMFAMYGGFIQSHCPTKILLSGNGNNRLHFQDCYYEGPDAPVILKCEVPAVSSNVIEIVRFGLHGLASVFADIDAFTSLKIDTVYRNGNAAKILKARNSNSGILLMGLGTPKTAPSTFDLDEASANDLVCISSGKVHTGKQTMHSAFQPALWTEGAESASPEIGFFGFNTTTERPRFYSPTAGRYRDTAYADDPVGLTEVLAPYAEAIFDPQVARLRTVVSSELDALVDVVNGAVGAPSGAGARPAFTASDDQLGGQASFSCALTGARFITGAFDTALPIGTFPALFVVFRKGAAQPSALRLILQAGDNLGGPTNNAMGLLADDVNFAGDLYGLYDTAVGGAALLDYAPIDAFGHLAYSYADPTGRFFMQMDDVPVQSDPTLQGSLTIAQPNFYLGTPASLAGSNVTIAYAAFLRGPLPDSVLLKAKAIARARFAL